MTRRYLSGIQPTGIIQLGNYLGAISNWVDLQHQHECILFIADLHALTLPHNINNLQTMSFNTVAALLACGIDPKKTSIFIQSHIKEHLELSWIFGCFTSIGWLNRMTQYKEKSANLKDKSSLGLYSYPVLQAADILIYKPTHIPVGEDQKQHVELTRDIATAFDSFFQTDIFKPLPEPAITKETARVMSLKDATKKMSKSDPNADSRIEFLDSDDDIRRKLSKAKTDGDFIKLEGAEKRLELYNLTEIYAALNNETINDVLTRYEGKGFAQFKSDLADIIINTIAPIRTRYKDLVLNKDYVNQVITDSDNKARKISQDTMDQVNRVVYGARKN